jgi:hypothetical protein
MDEDDPKNKRSQMGGLGGILDTSGKDGIQSIMEIFYEKADKYTLEQFMMDAAIRFYISNVSEIEID